MKRGFLNSKKAKDQPLHNNGAVGHQAVQGILAKPAEPYAVIHFPSLELTQSKEPSSTCVFRPSTCDKITHTPGFYTPLPPLNPTDVFTKNIPNMGVSLFSKCSVESRQVIFSERPLLVYPLEFRMAISDGLSKEEVTKRGDLKFEKILQLAFSEMTKEDADAYMSLSNCHPDSPPLYGIAKTNVFGTGTDIEESEGKAPYGVIGKLASRINHSCTPNVQIRFDIPTFSLQVIARRDVKAGEQLFHSYCELYQSVKERRRQLAAYGFECQCQACVNATPESDRLRKEMEDRIQKITDGKEEMFANPQFNIRSLDPLLELEKKIVEEGLAFGDRFTSLIRVILQACVKLKNRPKHIEYLNKWKKLTE